MKLESRDMATGRLTTTDHHGDGTATVTVTEADGTVVSLDTIDVPIPEEAPALDPVAAAIADLKGRQVAAFEEVLAAGTLSNARLRDAMRAALAVDP